jgi:hypothetical protein
MYSSLFLIFSQRLVGPRRRVPLMKHSHLVRVTRLSHPKAFDLSYSFGFRLSHPKEFDLSYSFGFRLGHPKEFEFSIKLPQ